MLEVEIKNKTNSIKELMQIPGIGKSIANDLYNINIKNIAALKNQSPEELYHLSNQFAGVIQDRCLLYVFRCAVYYATEKTHDAEKLKWWNWKEKV